MPDNNKKLGVLALAALVVSAMIGGGIFSMPQNIAQNASVMAVAAAWDHEFPGFEHITEGASVIDGIYHVNCIKN